MKLLSMRFKEVYRERELFFLLAPAILLLILFSYIPMYGLIIAFKDLKPGLTIFNSPWVGLKWFDQFLHSPYFWRSLKNTFVISVLSLLVQFPLPIIFALAINEIRGKYFKRITQSISYFPYFMSTVVVVGMMYNFLSVDSGIVNTILRELGMEPINFFNSEQWFKPLYIFSGLWQNLGWNAIIFLAALTAVDPTLYEAAKIDGASRVQQMRYISIPGIFTTIMILLLLNLGSILNVGFEKIVLMYNPTTYGVADVVSTYVYRLGIQGGEYSFATAVGLFNQVLNFMLLLFFNHMSKRAGAESLW
ncbi:ABC transporter permease [Paenibacillus eucommiae]|uniref:Aldouronate transport system permease protein n=1 Tax=Paenibacillus eucommiae TaxID=1355755 RepID=A0ABS4ILX1_9BACL|nr:ABC transporter permease subunit [Paenibacillus eucommiae]MBP1988567.1 putative aldouronate transport system permease protein [Paenibacillus eucommiae]